MAQASEAATAKSRRKTEAPEPGSGANGFDTVFPFSFSHFHTGNAATVTQANEILVQAARSIWESQAELFRLDVDSARNAFESFKVGVPPQQALSLDRDSVTALAAALTTGAQDLVAAAVAATPIATAQAPPATP